MQSATCNEYNKPWCYTMDEKKRFETCEIPTCQCGKTGLKYGGVLGGELFSVPGNLSYLIKDKLRDILFIIIVIEIIIYYTKIFAVNIPTKGSGGFCRIDSILE